MQLRPFVPAFEDGELLAQGSALQCHFARDCELRWVGSCRRDLLDHVIPLNERHLKRLVSEYVLYYHEDRTHLGLEKDTPAGRSSAKAAAGWRIVSSPRLGGLHHRYDLAA